MRPPFPFSALVGQDALTRALVLAAVQPALGGVLVRGGKGCGKSTAVRALAALLPKIATVAGCPFRREPGEELPGFPPPPGAALVEVPAPLVELPLGATEDRVLGSLHLERALRGERAFEPGLLAAANRGVLYIDEVNLLPDHLIDGLLDAAASGWHRLERDGLSLGHPARFLLVGTMNPDEGDLRPQLLDRFGLAADGRELTDPAERAEAVRRRLAYEADPAAFAARWADAERAEAARIARARARVGAVRLADETLGRIGALCLAAGVEGLRADLTVARAAAAHAAYEGRAEVTPADVDAVAELALAHRRTRPPEPPPGSPPSPGSAGEGPGVRGGQGNGRGRDDNRGFARSSLTPHPSPAEPGEGGKNGPAGALTVFASAGRFSTPVAPDPRVLERSARPGSGRGDGPPPRRATGPVRRLPPGGAIDLSSSVRAAAARGEPLTLAAADLRGRPRRGPAACLLVVVLDASGSMAAYQRMRRTKAAARALLDRSARRRDAVALVAFRGGAAEVVLPPTTSRKKAAAALERLPAGGPTPLAAGLAAADRLARAWHRKHPGQPAWAVLLTDGRANVGPGRGLRAAVPGVVIDTEEWPRLGRAADLAAGLGWPCVPLDAALGRPAGGAA